MSKTLIIARIHSVFANGFNVQYQNQLIYIGYKQQDLSVIGMNMTMPLLKDILKGIAVGELVKIKCVSDATELIELDWIIYSRPEVFSFTLKDVAVVDLTLPTMSKEALLNSGLVNVLDQAHVWQKSGFSKSSQMKQLFETFTRQPQEKRDIFLGRFIGAGLGLTPSGDDFLQGMILLEKVIQAESRIESYIQENLNSRTTTDVSLAYYHALFAGFVNRSWVELFAAIEKNDRQTMIKTIKLIQNYGSTSGNDFLVGLHTYITLY